MPRVSEIKLIRGDTTLDLSQKAEKVSGDLYQKLIETPLQIFEFDPADPGKSDPRQKIVVPTVSSLLRSWYFFNFLTVPL